MVVEAVSKPEHEDEEDIDEFAVSSVRLLCPCQCVYSGWRHELTAIHRLQQNVVSKRATKQTQQYIV